MISNNKKTASLILAVFLFGLDRYFKSLALSGHSVRLLGDFLTFNFTPNPYIAFSIPFSGLVLNCLVLIIILGLIWHLIKNYAKSQALFVLIFSSIIFGAISNLYDRITFAYVVDYFDCKYFTVFNLADVMISLSVLSYLFVQKKITPGSDLNV